MEETAAGVNSRRPRSIELQLARVSTAVRNEASQSSAPYNSDLSTVPLWNFEYIIPTFLSRDMDLFLSSSAKFDKEGFMELQQSTYGCQVGTFNEGKAPLPFL